MAIAVVVILLVVGSVIFHVLSPWWFTPIASNWQSVDDTVNITIWVTGVVFVSVNLFLAWCVLKFRHKEGRKSEYEPENKKLEIWLVGISAVGIAALLAPGLIVWDDIVTVPEDAMEVETVGQQWHWSHRFPGKDGKFGDINQSLISVDNPFGMDSDDPAGMDDILVSSPELHLPVNQPVKVLLRSKDVLHNFAVPQFRVKMDLVPGMVTFFWFEPTVEGRYDLLCEELCGIAHHAMSGSVVVESRDAYEQWLGSHPTYADTLNMPEPDLQAGRASYAPCSGCHGQNGEGNLALNAPKLTGLDTAYLVRQIKNFQQGIRGTDPADTLGMQMRGMASTLSNDAAIDNVVAYIGTLPDLPAAKTITGDVEHGEELYETCSYCHGKDGQGIWAMNAPRAAGMDDWYTAAQLKSFRDGLRGTHPQDPYGRQMAQIARMLDEDQEINDLVAYMNTLGSTRVASLESAEKH